MDLLGNMDTVKVGIAEWRIVIRPLRIITLGLGSCVGITLYDPVCKIGGLAHIMLPDSSQFPGHNNPGKFADLAIPMMAEEMYRKGAKMTAVWAKIAGGAQMFSFSDKQPALNIGARNVAMAKVTLQRIGVRLCAEDTGGNCGRTMILDTLEGEVLIRTVGTPLRKL